MAIDSTVFLSAIGLFVPFRTAQRGGKEGADPVGTVMIDAGVTGAAGGGTVRLSVAGTGTEFGFPMLWVPTMISTQDNLSAAEVVTLLWRNEGNDRLNTVIQEARLAVAGADFNIMVPNQLGILIDPSGLRVNTNLIQALWSTNTDTKTYHLHVYGPVYDAQLIARGGIVPELLAGLR